MTSTFTYTLTNEELAVIEAVAVRKSHHVGKWTMAEIIKTVHENAESSDLVDVDDEYIPVVIGQLIERGLVELVGIEEMKFRKA